MASAQAIISQLGNLSYLGVFGISLIANILIIIPEEVVLLGLGYVARAGKIDIFFIIPVVLVGLLASDCILYFFSRSKNRFIMFFYDKFFSKKLAVFSPSLRKNEPHWYERHIEKIIFYSRFLIQLRFVGPFMAGSLRVSFRKFLTYEVAALVIYVPLLLWIGWYFRSRVEEIITGIGHVKNIIAIGIALLIAFSLIQYLRKRLRHIS